jgi:hypothetical protein
MRHARWQERQRLVDIALPCAAFDDLLWRGHVGIGHQIFQPHFFIGLVKFVHCIIACERWHLLSRIQWHGGFDMPPVGALGLVARAPHSDRCQGELVQPTINRQIRGMTGKCADALQHHGLDHVVQG